MFGLYNNGITIVVSDFSARDGSLNIIRSLHREWMPDNTNNLGCLGAEVKLW